MSATEVRFLLADPAMVFAEDTLFPELVASPWNLSADPGDYYYYC